MDNKNKEHAQTQTHTHLKKQKHRLHLVQPNKSTKKKKKKMHTERLPWADGINANQGFDGQKQKTKNWSKATKRALTSSATMRSI